MKCSEKIRHLGPVDISTFTASLLKQPENIWNSDAAFQKKIAPYRDSKTIYLLMTLNDPNNQTMKMAGWDVFKFEFEIIAEKIKSYFPGSGRILNAQIAMLEPDQKIMEHYDMGKVLESSHRIHVPIVTDSRVKFIVDNENFYLEAGQAYELDNIRRHSVHNASPYRRIHLIIDLLA